MRKVKINKQTLAKLLMLASISPNKGNVSTYEKSYYNIYKEFEKILTGDEIRELVNMVDDEAIEYVQKIKEG